jgi:phosphate transport system substrate-binding protein
MNTYRTFAAHAYLPRKVVRPCRSASVVGLLVGIRKRSGRGTNLKRALLKCGALVVSALTVGGGAGLLTATPAHAVLSGSEVAVAAGGSDTTEKIMNSVVSDLTGRTVTVNSANKTARVFNVPAFSTASFVVPGDTECQDTTWTKDPLAPGSNTASTRGVAPFGSSAGRNYLAAEDGGTGPGSATGTDFGCIDVARSSGAPRAAGGGDRSTFEYYAFAFDAVSWATTSLKAPPTLTRQQITDIYDCNITDWSAVGGTPGPIVRYFPQAGSGTRSFFISDVLVGKASSYAPPSGGACTDGGPFLIEENQINGTTGVNGSSIADADLDKAIVPYSGALFNFQASKALNPSLDRRCKTIGVCARLGGINGSPTTATNASPIRWNGIDRRYELDTSGVVHESNVKQTGATSVYPGIRFVYNVLDGVGGGTRAGYQAGFQLMGFDNITGGFKSPMCDAVSGGTGDFEFNAIISNGFAPLPPTANGTSNQAGSTCRKYQGVT